MSVWGVLCFNKKQTIAAELVTHQWSPRARAIVLLVPHLTLHSSPSRLHLLWLVLSSLWLFFPGSPPLRPPRFQAKPSQNHTRTQHTESRASPPTSPLPRTL